MCLVSYCKMSVLTNMRRNVCCVACVWHWWHWVGCQSPVSHNHTLTYCCFMLIILGIRTSRGYKNIALSPQAHSQPNTGLLDGDWSWLNPYANIGKAITMGQIPLSPYLDRSIRQRYMEERSAVMVQLQVSKDLMLLYVSSVSGKAFSILQANRPTNKC